MKILYCDDDPEDRDFYFTVLTDTWKDLQAKGVVSEELELQTCADIAEHLGNRESRTFSDAAGFDCFLVDLMWPSDVPHGIDIAEALRKKYPEKPIIAFTVKTPGELFERLLNAGICAFLRKGESHDTLCFQILQSVTQHRKARGGQCLYRQLRELTTNGNYWAAASVGAAATEVWKLDRSQDRWTGFWDAFQGQISAQGLSSVFTSMRNFFRDSDLLTLGTLPGMRGHLDHVLNVYFTGYVISNTVPCFRKFAIDAAKRLFPLSHGKIDTREDEYWALFQIAWLAAATLHDTAYPLEVQPDLLNKCWEITTRFEGVLSGIGKVPELPCPTVLSSGLDAIGDVLSKLYPNGKMAGLVRENATFAARGGSRINHGVASGLLFLALAEKAGAIKGQDTEFDLYLKWAAAAMALHSLKIPGSKSGVSILLERDPLSYLLLACDEIQVWERERPDASRMSSPFEGTDLSEFSVSDTSIVARVDYALHNGPAAAVDFRNQRVSIDNHIEGEKKVLSAYLKANELSVRVIQRVPSEEDGTLAELCF